MIFGCVITVLVVIDMMMPLTNRDALWTKDKNTSISCDSIGMGEKTEFVSEVCGTNPTNYSSIIDRPPSSLSRANDKDSQSTDNATSTSL